MIFGAPGLEKKSALQLLALLSALFFISLPARADDSIILLVASPQLDSTLFERSVILVAPHDNGSAMGVILNRPLPVDPARLYPGDKVMEQIAAVSFGGPINPATVIFLFHSDEAEENAVYLFDDVYFSNDRQLLARQLLRPTAESRLEVFAGYAGWAPGQLQAEIMRGGWTTVKATKKLLFKIDRAYIWQELSNKKGRGWI